MCVLMLNHMMYILQYDWLVIQIAILFIEKVSDTIQLYKLGVSYQPLDPVDWFNTNNATKYTRHSLSKFH